MQKLSRRRVAEYAALQLSKQESPKKLAQYLVAYLVESKQLHAVELLLSDIDQTLAEKHGVVVAEVTAARPLAEALRTAITNVIRTKYSANQVVVSETQDPELIGGVVIETPEGYFDGSVRKKLRNLQAMHKEN